MPLFLNDLEFFEGLLGGLGWIISMFYLKMSYKNHSNTLVLGLVSWCILWFTRKIGMRIYKGWREESYLKDRKNVGLTITNITPLSDNNFRILCAIITFILIYYFLIYNQTFDDNFTINNSDFYLMGFISLIGLMVYI